MNDNLKYGALILAILALLYTPVLLAQSVMMVGPGVGKQVRGAIAFVIGTSAGSTTSNNVTTSPGVDTTGSTLLVAAVGSIPGTVTVTDSKTACASWTGLTQQGTTFGMRIFYCANPSSVGSGHTFTASSTGLGPSLCVATFSNVTVTTPFDQQNGGAAFSTTIQATGSITPTTDNQLIISGASDSDGHASAFTNNASMTIANFSTYNSGLSVGCIIAYKIQTTATAINAIWASNSGAVSEIAAAIASFKGL